MLTTCSSEPCRSAASSNAFCTASSEASEKSTPTTITYGLPSADDVAVMAALEAWRVPGALLFRGALHFRCRHRIERLPVGCGLGMNDHVGDAGQALLDGCHDPVRDAVRGHHVEMAGNLDVQID